MGINGLLKYLTPVQRDRNISQYAGQTVAIDSYCWLHRGIYSCALDLATGNPTDKLSYALSLNNERKIEVLLSYKIRPVVIFDGGPLPSKGKTESDRDNSRQEKRKQAFELLKAGNVQEAQRKFGESVDVTPQLAFSLYKVLREKYDIECIVSPYEADAQLAYLSRTGYVDVIITEDSDLLAFGARKVFYKMDAQGNGKEISLEDIRTIRGDVSPDSWNHKLFLSACILAGCDYLQSIKGIGFKKAYKLMGDMKDYRAVLRHLKLEGKHSVPQDYEERFEKAFLTFRFQRVFCPLKKCLVTLNKVRYDLAEENPDRGTDEEEDRDVIEAMAEVDLISKISEISDMDFLGADMSIELAQNIAYGIIDPITKKRYLTEASKQQMFQLDAWISEGPKSSNSNVKSLLKSSSFNSDGFRYEDESTNQSTGTSQFNNNEKAKYYKVAKPKLVGAKAHQFPKAGNGQKNIKDFFRQNDADTQPEGGRALKIRNFFKEKKAFKESDTVSPVEERLTPSETFDPDEMPDEEPKRNEEVEGEGEGEEDNKPKKPHLKSVFKKQESFSNEYDIFYAKNAGTSLRASKSVNKAFKLPSVVKRDEDKQPVEEPERNLKRKSGPTAIEAFNEFAFTKIQKREPLPVLAERNETNTYTYQAKPKLKAQLHKKEEEMDEEKPQKARPILDSVQSLSKFSFESLKKSEVAPPPPRENPRRTVYRINLTIANQSDNLPLDMASLYSAEYSERSRIQNFFKLNPIEKTYLKEKLHEKKNDWMKFDVAGLTKENNLDQRLSALLFNFD